jgi:fructose-1,6-bisphosphatase/inositol monophosphatase family enzyme
VVGDLVGRDLGDLRDLDVASFEFVLAPRVERAFSLTVCLVFCGHLDGEDLSSCLLSACVPLIRNAFIIITRFGNYI